MKSSPMPRRAAPMPRRSAELVARAALEPRARLERATPMPRPLTPPKPPRRPGMAVAVTRPVDARDDRCVLCGADGHLERHHRCSKRMGGDPTGRLDVPSNLVRLCGWGNHTGCHGWVHGPDRLEVARRGLLLPDGADFRAIPVLMHDGWWLLDDAGDRHPAEAPA